MTVEPSLYDLDVYTPHCLSTFFNSIFPEFLCFVVYICRVVIIRAYVLFCVYHMSDVEQENHETLKRYETSIYAFITYHIIKSIDDVPFVCFLNFSH